MTDQEKIEALKKKLQAVEQHHQQITEDITRIRKEIHAFHLPQEPEKVSSPAITQAPVIEEKKPGIVEYPVVEPLILSTAKPSRKKEKTPLEEFIGTNLLNKIGIAVLVVGISFGVKYAIDHDMLSPLTRIVLGYLAGGILIGIAVRLKKNYHSFSAVLLSGGMASLYFITYAAYDFYQLIPQLAAFAIMVLFTLFTVFAALQYNLQVVAVIGLVGAYGVPFLLSDGSGRVAILFSYITILNTGILYISFRKTWRLLFGMAFSLTWLMYGVWMVSDFSLDRHFWLSLGFATVFFVLFYLAFVVGKLVQEVKLTARDIVLVLLNCFIYYGSGYALINEHPNGELYLGLFTVANALLHFVVCVILFSRTKDARDSFYFVAGLVLTFLTLAVPVQLEGSWVTLIWAMEAALLFWIGRNKNFPVYELLSYPLMALACLSLLHDWSTHSFAYYNYYADEQLFKTIPFLNVNLFTSLVVAGMFGFVTWQSAKTKPGEHLKLITTFQPFIRIALPAALLVILYVAFYQEISLYFNQQLQRTAIRTTADEYPTGYNYDWMSYRALWLICYSAFFVVVLWMVNLRFVKNTLLNYVIGTAGVLVVISFLSGGLNQLEVLRYNYLRTDDAYYTHGIGNLLIRYLSYLFIAVLLVITYTLSAAWSDSLRKAERLFFHFTLLTLLSSELLNILALNDIHNGFKLALSILWGGYALYLIIRGFAKDQSYLRISGITLFAITLLKLFFYDMKDMGTIAKTVVLMILGVLMLIASFIYNQRKKKLQDHDPDH